MWKKVYKNVDLTCVLQDESSVNKVCKRGTLSVCKEGALRFEEHAAERVKSRNPKLYVGTHITLVRLQNGEYQPYFKCCGTEELLREGFVQEVYFELQEALDCI